MAKPLTEKDKLRILKSRGCVQLRENAKPPHTWIFYVNEIVHGRRKVCYYNLGDTDELPTEADARAAADFLLRERGGYLSIADMIKHRMEGSDHRKLPEFSPQWYMNKLKEQDGKCAICGRKPNRLVVDHCHDTGRLRGLLCGNCNSGIGMLRDDAAVVRSAFFYLEGYGQ